MALRDKELERLDPGQLMPIIVEEAGELLQALGKLARFGPYVQDGEVTYDNFQNFIMEFEQLTSAVEQFATRHGVNLSDAMMKQYIVRNGGVQ